MASSTMVGFIGAGRMAQALAKGFIKGGVRKPHQILASAPKNDVQSIEEMKVTFYLMMQLTDLVNKY